MAILKILQYPDVRLKKKADPVEVFDDDVKKMINDMFETLHNAKNCAGLAATQLDIKHPKHVTVIYDYTNEETPEKHLPSLCLVNAKIIMQEGETYEPEGCMSISGGIYEPVKRAERITVRAQDQHGTFFELNAKDFMAKLIQHELDHLNGVIFIDHVSRLKRQRIDKKVAKHRQELKKE